jgi:hypothetical protein
MVLMEEISINAIFNFISKKEKGFKIFKQTLNP